MSEAITEAEELPWANWPDDHVIFEGDPIRYSLPTSFVFRARCLDSAGEDAAACAAAVFAQSLSGETKRGRQLRKHLGKVSLAKHGHRPIPYGLAVTDTLVEGLSFTDAVKRSNELFVAGSRILHDLIEQCSPTEEDVRGNSDGSAETGR